MLGGGGAGELSVRCPHVPREPDSTYFDLPPSDHAGSNEVANRTEVTMDVFQMRSMNDSVMVSELSPHVWELHPTQPCVPCGELGAPGWDVGWWLVHEPNTRTTLVQGLITCH